MHGMVSLRQDLQVMQDNAPSHKAAQTLRELSERQITPIEWPPYSPDFNPIENVWNMMENYIQFKYPDLGEGRQRSQDELRDIVKESWDRAVDENDLERLIESMPRRISYDSAMKSSHSSLSTTNGIPIIPLIYNPADSQTSALRLILALRPDWKDGKIEFIRFTDGITNTLLKVINKLPELSAEEIDDEAILLRGYGRGTDVLIDREREARNHELLMQYKLAPKLLARFQNGMLYRFLPGSVTSPADLRRRDVWLAIARRLAEWHAVVPCIPTPSEKQSSLTITHENNSMPSSISKNPSQLHGANNNTEAAPNIWTVMQKWINALPTGTEVEKNRQANLQKELAQIISELSHRPGLGENGLVFAHCDLLSGNIIIQPHTAIDANAPLTVNFIDFEYATPSPAAFDIANHFAEWGGLECDYSKLPTKSQRLDFINEYISSYFSHLQQDIAPEKQEAEARQLFAEVDIFRGVPGFYWGIWALIQATISQIDFDYASYAELRLNEYWAWKAERDGSCATSEKAISPRETRWAQES
ncbi:hypothetical protein K3495_g9975 [Podosphaera aphanis]|nr:hypothetical protein K3495_g9975 [Podosphaera aphanis]